MTGAPTADRPRVEHPEEISDGEAVRLVHWREIDSIAGYLAAGLSVLVRSEGDLVPHLCAAVLTRRTDLRPVDANTANTIAEEVSGAPAGQALALAHLDAAVASHHGTPSSGPRQLVDALNREPDRVVLGFVDPMSDVPRALGERFGVEVLVDPLPPLLHLRSGTVPIGRALFTRAEAAIFADFDEATVYSCLVSLNVVGIRRLLRSLVHAAGAREERLPLARLGSEAVRFRRRTVARWELLQAPAVRYADVAGYAVVKYEMRDQLTRSPRTSAGVLLHGPAGNGKTLIARAAAGELDANLVVLSCRATPHRDQQLLEHAGALLELARRTAPGVLLIDDLDALDDAGHTAGGWSLGNTLLAHLIERIQRTAGAQQVPLIATTRRPETIDAALLRSGRLRPVGVGLPDLDARRSLAAHYARRVAAPVDGALLDAVARATDGFSCDDISAMCHAVATGDPDDSAPSAARRFGEYIGTMHRARRRASARLVPPVDPQSPGIGMVKTKTGRYQLDDLAVMDKSAAVRLGTPGEDTTPDVVHHGH
ncbi:ATP-binding protein [Actinoplanes sp. NPDC049118]|uniref:ATP-binding protein n=1 Tax=Actinoplanes sp. NPDC049118 TaxID=3155769 RepID=UPI0033C91E2F